MGWKRVERNETKILYIVYEIIIIETGYQNVWLAAADTIALWHCNEVIGNASETVK